MDTGEIVSHTAGSAGLTGFALALSKLLRWRREERDEDAAKLRAEAFEALKGEVAILKHAQTHTTKTLDDVVAKMEQVRDDVRADLLAHRKITHDDMNHLTGVILKLQVSQRRIEKNRRTRSGK